MGDETSTGTGRVRRKSRPAALSPEAEARFARRMSVLLGLVPLPAMTQAETDWVFRQKVRTAGDQQEA